jgi:hypothetical protein
MKIPTIIAGHDRECPIFGPEMMVLKTGEIGTLIGYSLETWEFELKMPDGTIQTFQRNEVDNVES